jgi:predicted RNA binding protein YcfA (HicA-like mRNA interferase family)
MPARLSALMRALETMGVEVVRPNGGSHWKAKKDGKTYPIPAHNGEKSQIGDDYLKGLCRCFHVDLDVLKSHL